MRHSNEQIAAMRAQNVARQARREGNAPSTMENVAAAYRGAQQWIGRAYAGAHALQAGMSATNFYSEALRTERAGYKSFGAAASTNVYAQQRAAAHMALTNERASGTTRAIGALAGSAGAIGGGIGFALGGPVGAIVGNYVGGKAGQILAAVNDIRTRELRVKVGEQDVMAAARASGGASREQILATVRLAERRAAWDDAGSKALGEITLNTWGRFQEKIGTKDYEEVAKKVAATFDRFSQYKNEGDQRALAMDFAGAQTSYENAEKEAPALWGWRDPIKMWANNDAAVKAHAIFATTQNPLPALREGY